MRVSALSFGTMSLCLYFQLGCGGGGTGENKVLTPNQSEFIYIAGWDASGARIWKNGVPVPLQISNSDSLLFSVCRSGLDLYAVGSESNGTHMIAKVWKNGVPTSLSDGSNDEQAYSIAVSGSDVYVGGAKFVVGQPTVANFWKNGNQIPTMATSYAQSSTSVAILGSDYYFAMGSDTLGSPIYLKNGSKYVLPNPQPTPMYLSSGFSFGNDIYFLGGDSSGNSYTWKNGIFDRSGLSPNGSAYSFCINGPDVYIVGFTNGSPNQPAIWKNGTIQVLGNSTFGGVANSIFVNNGNVYATGYEFIDSNHTPIVRIWKNGSLMYPNAFQANSASHSIWVVFE